MLIQNHVGEFISVYNRLPVIVMLHFLTIQLHQEAKESKKSKSGHKSKGTKNKGKGSDKVVINTEKIDLLLDMIKGADVTSEENLAENETLLELEGECAILTD